MWDLFRKASPNVRPPAVAGRFYPGNPAELRRMIEGFLREVKAAAGPACVAEAASTQRRPVPKAIIAPHAGYIYSGPIAASAYARLAPSRETIKRVVLLGPSHRTPFKGLAAAGAEAFATPLGTVPVDTAAIRDLCQRLLQVSVLDEAHEDEHALEVQLPFLQVVLADFKIIPLLVGEADDKEVAEVIEALWGGDETRFVISSDLSHYHDHATAHELDTATARAIEELRPRDIGGEQACGCRPIHGLLRVVKARGLRVCTLDLRNSGDTAGPRNEVVGYGAFAFEETAG
jgi:AmmeMemoRadiSam system protein B